MLSCHVNVSKFDSEDTGAKQVVELSIRGFTESEHLDSKDFIQTHSSGKPEGKKRMKWRRVGLLNFKDEYDGGTKPPSLPCHRSTVRDDRSNTLVLCDGTQGRDRVFYAGMYKL
ncbi:hypothetical protein EYF80_016802 [Liparis tanakae]|uniref:Uncharacterized protein n=1 Tax=Liparis tanakae TaxID=230148 RepID=A0A4Z2I6V0_9TELE|nr:hypothetical protein EYF80_016802 [Liparis tanakae]